MMVRACRLRSVQALTWRRKRGCVARVGRDVDEHALASKANDATVDRGGTHHEVTGCIPSCCFRAHVEIDSDRCGSFVPLSFSLLQLAETIILSGNYVSYTTASEKLLSLAVVRFVLNFI